MSAAVPRAGRFGGDVVWITGAGSGMGRRHAERFAAEGAAVGCLDVDEDAAAAVAAEIVAAGGRAVAVAADVGDADSMEAAAALLEDQLGPAAAVVANAGVVPAGLASVADTDPAEWERVLRVNLRGAYLTAKVSLPRLRRTGEGAVLVLVSSAAGVAGFPGYSSYVAAKHGVIGLMRALANELGPEGIRVNALCPGTVDTPILDGEAASAGVSREELAAIQARTHLIERLIEPDEMSDALLWLCSEQAAMVTGIELLVDGGFVAKRQLT